ncbi:MAG: hypothetical protein QF552_00870 [Litorilituus sp.]|nr:hypothetical protein [Litorilituus sp.]
MASYKIIFKGEICENSDRDKIDTLLAKFFKIPVEKASQLFNGKEYSLKKRLDVDDAIAMQQKLLGIGVITRLIKEETLASDITYQQAEPQSQHVEPDPNKTDESQQAELSVWWQKKFVLIEKLEVESYKPSFKEKFFAQFNPLALLLNIIYYFIKGMWTKGILLWFGMTVYWVLLEIIEENGIFIKESLYVVPPFMIPMLLVNRDYYLFKTKGEITWGFVPQLFIKPFAQKLMALFCIISLALDITFAMLPIDLYDGVWRANKDGATVKIELSAFEPSISINGTNFPVLEVITDDTDLATLKVQMVDGSSVNWKLKTIEDNNGEYYIAMKTHSGRQDRLSYVKDIY